MPSAQNRRTLAHAIVASAASCAWYSIPDHLQRRGPRAWATAAVLAASAAATVRIGTEDPPVPEPERDEAPRGGEAFPGRPEGSPAGQDGASDPDEVRTAKVAGTAKVADAAAIVVGALGPATATMVAQERLLHGLGERLGRRGVSHPHTRVGLVLGGVVGASASAELVQAFRRWA